MLYSKIKLKSYKTLEKNQIKTLLYKKHHQYKSENICMLFIKCYQFCRIYRLSN